MFVFASNNQRHKNSLSSDGSSLGSVPGADAGKSIRSPGGGLESRSQTHELAF